jgi:hypothetical protein
MFDGLDNPGWVIVGQGLITESGYEFNLVSDSDPVQDIIRRPVYGQGSFVQRIVLHNLMFGDVDPIDFGVGSTVALHHYFTVGDLNTRAIVSLSEPEEDGVWQLTFGTTGPKLQREVALVPEGTDYASLSLRYDHQLSTLTGLYDPDLSDDEPAVALSLPIELELSQESETRLSISTALSHNSGVVSSWSLEPLSNILGDFNGNGLLDATDIDQLSAQIRTATNDPLYDLNADSLVDDRDRQIWVHDLKQTFFGDADLNGSFDSTDLVQVLASGEYEDGVELNSSWRTGDWDGDRDFTSGDLVAALADGGYGIGPGVVPEPSGTAIALAAAALAATLGRRCSKTRRK